MTRPPRSFTTQQQVADARLETLIVNAKRERAVMIVREHLDDPSRPPAGHPDALGSDEAEAAQA
jgi:hypothetical protein